MRPTSTGVALAAPAHVASLFDPALTKRSRLDAHGAIEDVAWAPGGRLAALIDEEGLRVLDLARDGVRWRVVGKSYACHFTPDGDGLWLVRPAVHGPEVGDGPGAFLELRDSGNGLVHARHYLADPFGGSAFTLAPHPERESILVWVAAPEGASRSLLARAKGRALTVEALPFEGGYPPEPLAGGVEYLLARGDALERRRWDEVVARDELLWPWLDDSPLAVLGLGGARALWASQSGRLHLIDVADMSYLEEVCVAERPPRPIVEYVPTADGAYWGTDFQQMGVAGELVLVQFGDRLLVALALAELCE